MCPRASSLTSLVVLAEQAWRIAAVAYNMAYTGSARASEEEWQARAAVFGRQIDQRSEPGAAIASAFASSGRFADALAAVHAGREHLPRGSDLESSMGMAQLGRAQPPSTPTHGLTQAVGSSVAIKLTPQPPRPRPSSAVNQRSPQPPAPRPRPSSARSSVGGKGVASIHRDYS